jgi:hypothetical protein
MPGTPSRARDLVCGFIAGAFAVVAFHQVMVFVLSSVGMIRSPVYAMRGVPPYGVPILLNQMFWGGLWGLLFAAIADTLPRWPLLLLGCGFGVLGPVLASWFVVAPLKGNPIAAGWMPRRMLAGILINGFWGIGLALLYAGLRHWTSGSRQVKCDAYRLWRPPTECRRRRTVDLCRRAGLCFPCSASQSPACCWADCSEWQEPSRHSPAWP